MIKFGKLSFNFVLQGTYSARKQPSWEGKHSRSNLTNNSVMFLKQEDIILTDDAWHVTAELEVNSYEEAVLTIRNDLRVIYESKREFTSIAELRQIEVLLDTLETRIQNFRHLLPKPDNRRGLMNIGGTALKVLFGVATASDVMRLHQTIEEFEAKNADTTHSLESQMTYVKNLDLSSRLQTQSIANLSTVVKKL